MPQALLQRPAGPEAEPTPLGEATLERIEDVQAGVVALYAAADALGVDEGIDQEAEQNGATQL